MAREVNIPFSGFYETRWSDLVDSAMEREAEYLAERESSDHYEEFEPNAELRLGNFYAENIWQHADYSAAHDSIARDFADGFNGEASERIGFELGLTFATMTSPRFYNFETDRIFCEVSDETARKLFAFSKERDNHDTFRRVIEERHTSRSGFASFYSTDEDHWFRDDAPDFYDHNETGTLLRACLALAKDPSDEDLEWAIYYPMAECDHEYLDKAMNWAKFEAACEERRAELRADYAIANGIEPEAIPYRCPNTPDLFGEARP